MPESLKKLLSPGVAFIHDLLMIPIAWVGAHWLRFNLEGIPQPFLDRALVSLLLVIPAQAAVFWVFGLYRGVWRFASLPDLVRIGKAVGVGLLFVSLLVFGVAEAGIPRSAPLLYAILLGLLLTAPRFLYRWVKDHRFGIRSGQRVLIVGAGGAGEMLVRDLLRNGRGAYLPVGFVDDDPRKRGKEIHGVRVLGPTTELRRLVNEFALDILMLAVPSASLEQRRRLVELAEECAVPFRTVPQLEDLVSGNVRIDQLREVVIEDLLGREPVSLDWEGIRAGVGGRVILVTGAGGSIGSELCRQIARMEPAALVLLDNSEFNLYAVDLELGERFPGVSRHAVLGDVVDRVAVERVFEKYRPQLVFHAAAYKHVPLLESHIREAVRNNVLGTREVALAADRYGCSEFVLISTDKAVRPANVMGTTKRVAEIFCHNLNARSSTRFVTVRFGNVLGSAGSVVPLFRRQIEAGGPVTVTHPKMERYFMTIREACQLIMQAGVMGGGGEIFVLDMGEPVRIAYLAEQMIRLSGKTPGEEVAIRYTGLRPGEKLYEELFHEREEPVPTSQPGILLARHSEMSWDVLNQCMKELQSASEQYDVERLAGVLGRVVPERSRESAPAQAPATVVPLRP